MHRMLSFALFTFAMIALAACSPATEAPGQPEWPLESFDAQVPEV